jgi:hypothetical protein
MKHSQLSMGHEFWYGGKRCRCADVGSPVITAISLEPREVVSIETDSRNGSRTIERR